MAATIDLLSALLDDTDIKYHHDEERDTLLVSYSTDNYVHRDGDHHAVLAIELPLDGRLLRISAPFAFRASGPTRNPVLQACAQIQNRAPLVRFEWDPTDGEIRPAINWPLEDSSPTAAQVHAAIGALITVIDGFANVVTFAAEHGEVDLSLTSLKNRNHR